MNRLSKITIFLIFIVLAAIRLHYAKWDTLTVVKVLTWDAFGYYMYLPGQFIYHDIRKLEWVDKVQEQYSATGSLYQISALPNGNKVIKYPIGIAVLYAPFVALGHVAAAWSGYPQDGFSAPYQLAVCVAALLYALLGLWVLRWVLLRYVSDRATALTLLLVALATNYPQYVSMDSGMTHGYLFSL